MSSPSHYDSEFFFGSMAAFATLWLLTDVLSKGRNLYTLLACVIIAQALLILIQIVITAAKNSDDLIVSETFSVIIFAYIWCISVVLQLQLIPLFVAGRYRDLNSPWELPLAG